MSRVADEPPGESVWVEHISVRWIEPPERSRPRRIIIFLPHFSGTKEQTTGFLRELAVEDFVALSFDPWQHGERGAETSAQMLERVFGAFRKRMWPILGQTTLDTLRVIDWAIATLGVQSTVRIGGLSMGGDIAVAAAGLDHRIERVAAVVATPDWLRPGMHHAFRANELIDQGVPDAYAQYFYDQLNPLTHLERYAHGPAVDFFCGENDTHVPPDGALRFQTALRRMYPENSDRVNVRLIPGLMHMDVRDPNRWWPDCRRWLTSP